MSQGNPRELRRVQEGRRRTATVVRRAGGDLQVDLRPLPHGDQGLGETLPERVDARDIALLGMATHKLSLVGAAGRGHEPPARPFHRAPGEGEPQEGRRGAPRRGPSQVGRRAPDVQVLPQHVARLFLYLRPRARAARHPPRGRHIRRGDRLGLPAPGLQGPDDRWGLGNAAAIFGRT